MSNYIRVLPRDLFNEASLLKCIARLWIVLDETRDHGARIVEEDVPSFDIAQNEASGAIYVRNLTFEVRGVAFNLERPLNSRAPWPLWVEGRDDNPEFDPIEVFDDAGNLSPDMAAFIADPVAPIRYQRGRSDYAAIRNAASHPEQLASVVSEEEFEEMLGVVPPIYIRGVPGFLVGEALTGDERGTVYANYFRSRDGVHCARYQVVTGGEYDA